MRERIIQILIIVLCGAVCAPLLSSAQTADQLKQAIAEHNAQIDALHKQISQYEQQLTQTSAKKQTLQNVISQLNLNIKKVSATINVTKNQIGATQLEIQDLQNNITDKQTSIDSDQAALVQSLKNINEADQSQLIAQILSSDSISASWEDVDKQQELQIAIRNQISNLADERKQLTDIKSQRETKAQALQDQKQTLLTQQGSLTATKSSQADLLAQTKSQESTYQKLIAAKKSQESSFEDALSDLQSKLQVAVNQADITPAGKGVLQWPLDHVVITQFFGNTPFASTGAYNGKGHNGVDLGTPIGTPIKAALSGVILATGNTDLAHSANGSQCYSFGKWVMIKHDNGLSTMYAHLSKIDVTQGQQVTTGDVIGYSGETGYATGPHLHFGVYVSAVTQIMKLGDATKVSTPCAGATMPVPPLAGYLNPMNYLPGSGYVNDAS